MTKLDEKKEEESLKKDLKQNRENKKNISTLTPLFLKNEKSTYFR